MVERIHAGSMCLQQVGHAGISWHFRVNDIFNVDVAKTFLGGVLLFTLLHFHVDSCELWKDILCPAENALSVL
jgi:hypothetical protein